MQTKTADAQISVIITTYNDRDFIGQAISSVLKQTLPAREIIILDDGSSDGTEEFLAREFSGKIRYHRQQNRGPSAARNTAAAMAQGDYVAFLDADDWWRADKLKAQADLLLRSPLAALVSCDRMLVDVEGRELSRTRYSANFDKSYIKKELKVRTLFPPGTAFIRRDVYQRLGGFNESIRIGEDREFWARIAAGHDIVSVPEPLLYTRVRSNSLSHQTQRLLDDTLIVNKLVRRTLASNGPVGWLSDEALLKIADSRLFHTISMLYDRAGDRKQALKYSLQAVLCWPPQILSTYRLMIRLLIAPSGRRAA